MAFIVIQPDGTAGKDSMLELGSPTTNYETTNPLSTGKDKVDSTLERSVIQFDLSSIPVGSTINSATLALTLYYAGDLRSNNNRLMRVYRITRAWTESEVTWNKSDASTNWGTAGCANTSTDREATDIGSGTFSTTDLADAVKTIDLTPSKIQEMITGGVFTNNGFLLQMDTENEDRYFWYSSDAAGSRPSLTIDYTPTSGSFFAFI